MEGLRCPKCGSDGLSQPRPDEYQCLKCGTRFMLLTDRPRFVDVVLVQAGRNRTDVIRVLRDVSYDEPTIKQIELARAVQLADSTPCVVIPDVPYEVGERVKAKLEKTGAAAELKPS